MTMPRYGAKRDASEPEIVKALRNLGVDVVLIDQPCDAILGFRGRTVLAEFKTGKAKLKKHQSDFKNTWRGSAVLTMRTPDDAINFVNGAA